MGCSCPWLQFKDTLTTPDPYLAFLQNSTVTCFCHYSLYLKCWDGELLLWKLTMPLHKIGPSSLHARPVYGCQSQLFPVHPFCTFERSEWGSTGFLEENLGTCWYLATSLWHNPTALPGQWKEQSQWGALPMEPHQVLSLVGWDRTEERVNSKILKD